MPEDSGFTQINDVILNIPPEQINIDRKSLNYSWQALRTTSSIKTKSGYSQLDISMRVMFTGENLGYIKLRNLVAQFRVTPFCYVENKYLRDQIMGGVRGKNMALALKSMTINKAADDSPDVVEVVFYFSWFNYLPYTSNFTFKKEPFLVVEVKDPRKSVAWAMMYQAEINRAKNMYKQKLGVYREIKTNKLGETPSSLSFTEYKTLTGKQYNFFKREKAALRKLRTFLKENLNNQNDVNDIVSDMYTVAESQDAKGQELLNHKESEVLMEELFGRMTSLSSKLHDNKHAARELYKLLNRQLSSSSATRFRNILNQEEWKVSLIGRSTTDLSGNPKIEIDAVTFGGSPDANRQDLGKDTAILVERQRKVEVHRKGQDNIILSGISISFQNILAVLPIKGFTYPTFQHIGSVDAVVSLSFIAKNESGAKQLNEFYNTIEEQSSTIKQIPQGHRNLVILNDLVNMCGLAEFMPDSISTQTIPGSPGHSAITMTLLNNPITSTTQERLVDSNGLINNHDIKKRVAEIFTDNLRFLKEALSRDTSILGLGTTPELRSLKQRHATVANVEEHVKSSEFKQRLKEIQTKYPDATYEITSGNNIVIHYELGYFTYKGSMDPRHEQFRELCKKYGKHLGHALASILDIVENYFKDSEDREKLHALYSLTESDVLSVEVLQDTINDIMDYVHQRPSNLRFTEESLSRKRVADIVTAGEVVQGVRTTGGASVTREQIATFIKESLEDWVAWSNQFIDTVLTSNITLPQFSDILAEISLLSERHAVTAYPDFPLAEVVDIMQSQKKYNKVLLDLQTKLFQESQTQRVKFDSINFASLISPDFYFFNRIGDTRKGFIGAEKVKAAKDAIQVSQKDKRADAEQDWFRNVYEKSILGDQQAEEIRKAKLNFGKNFFDKGVLDILEQANAADEFFVPSDLIQDGDGLQCTIAQKKDTDKPVTLLPIKSGWEKESQRGSGWTAANRSGGPMRPNSMSFEIQHRYGLDALDILSAFSQTNPVYKKQDGIEWSWPTGPQTRRITSRYNPFERSHPTKTDEKGNPIKRPHKAIDLGSTDKKGSLGHPVYAAADGEIVATSFSADEWSPGKPMSEAGINVQIRHSNGYKTKYLHLLWDRYTEKLSSFFWGTSSSPDIRSRPGPFKVRRGERIGSIGKTGGISSGPHLHFEVIKNSKHIDPETIFNAEVEKLTEIFTDADPQNKSLLTRSAEQFEKDFVNGQGFGMIRAYPTYRLYFIESDINERKRYQFDDFFSYSSVVSIELIRNCKLAADLLMIRLTNTSGVLNNRKFKNTTNPNRARQADGAKATEESSIASFMLKTGTQIQLALGYNSNVNQLDTPFNGVITDIQFSGNDEIIDITCQSFGIQLVQSIHGKVKEFGGFLDDSSITGEICEQLLAEPELTHFGRWTPGQPPRLGGFRSLLTDRWTFTPQPADDNIFAPTGRGIWGIFDSSPNFVLYHSTVWDAMQELTLRHPSMIAYPVPYQGFYGPRMTMFFGVPDQLYFARDPLPRELNIAAKFKRIALEAQEKLTSIELSQLLDANVSVQPDLLDRATTFDQGEDVARKFWIEETTRRLALNTGIIKPFRSYHLINSSQHIIHNNISNSLYNVFNTVTIQYDDDGPEVDDDGNNITGFLKFDDRQTYTLRCDAALPDEEVRELFVQFPNCVGEEMAKRYCVSLLRNSLKKGYKGTLTLTGNANIKPHDICYIFDHHNDMYGPVEVEQVVLSFSQKTGFITEITPNMCIHVNEHTTMATQDAVGLIAEGLVKDTFGINTGNNSVWEIGSIAGTGVVAAGATAAAGVAAAPALAVGALATAIAAPVANAFFNSSEIALGMDPTVNPFKLIGGFIFSKAITRSQLAHPFRYSPLVKGGQSMLGGLPKQLDVKFIQGVQKWIKDSYEGAGLLISDTIDKLNPNAWAYHSTGDFAKTVFDKEGT